MGALIQPCPSSQPGSLLRPSAVVTGTVMFSRTGRDQRRSVSQAAEPASGGDDSGAGARPQAVHVPVVAGVPVVGVLAGVLVGTMVAAMVGLGSLFVGGVRGARTGSCCLGESSPRLPSAAGSPLAALGSSRGREVEAQGVQAAIVALSAERSGVGVERGVRLSQWHCGAMERELGLVVAQRGAAHAADGGGGGSAGCHGVGLFLQEHAVDGVADPARCQAARAVRHLGVDACERPLVAAVGGLDERPCAQDRQVTGPEQRQRTRQVPHQSQRECEVARGRAV